jgi:probable F420-dependent oxidoreductase
MVDVMRMGVHLPHAGRHATARGAVETAVAAEAAGYGSVWLFDHLFTPTNIDSSYPFANDGSYPLSPDDPYLDPVALMGVLAGVTERIEFGTRVLIAAYRPPVVLAKELATIDAVAGGRMVLGVGAGWMREEFDAVGVPFERRHARLREHVAVMRAAWSNGVSSYDGEFYGHVEAGFQPAPPRESIPILLGGYGDLALRRVAEWADGWAAVVRNEETLKNPHVAVSPEALAERLEKLRAACAEVGRPYEELRIVAAASPRDDPGVLRAYADLGVHDCDLMVWGDGARVIDELRRFADDVGTEL